MSGKRALGLALTFLAATGGMLQAQPPHNAADATPVIRKIDPPNWWANLPTPMLLVNGDHLDGARFSLSDPHLTIQQTHISANGHWAELWLSASPATPETIQLNANRRGAHVSAPYTFAPRHATEDSFAGFSSKDVMYLIMTDRFADGDTANDADVDRSKPRAWHGGDLRGILQHLDYLQRLGITAVWITPVYQNHETGSYHGYGATNMYAVDEHYGTLDDLKALAAALHQRHMKLVLDMVPNHVGPNHPWVNDEPEPDWFHGTKADHTEAVGDFKQLVDPHSAWRDRRDILDGWFANILPDMNQENPRVAQYLIQNAVWWTEETGLDGIRIDTFPYVARPFWHSFEGELHTLYPHLSTVGEIMNGDATIVSAFAGGVQRTGLDLAVDTGLDTPFDYPFYFALRDVFLKDAPFTRIGDILRLDDLYPHPERLVIFLGNHDVARFMNDPAATPARLALAFTLITTTRGTPELYAGDELAMRGGDDPDNRHDFPGGFPASTADAFTAAGRTPQQQQAFTTLQRLLALRHAHPALESGEQQTLRADNNVLIYARTLPAQHILVALNKSDAAQDITMATTGTALAGLTHIQSLEGAAETPALTPSTITLHLAAQSAVIFELR
jgi:glycosidase